MKAVHTLGPWNIRRAPAPTDGATDYAIIDSETNIIAEAFGRTSETHYPPAEANARLIAAAPELLEALKALWQHIEDEMSGYWTEGTSNFMQQAQAAITKAEDEQS